MGKFSKQWMLQECNIKQHCLDVELLTPMYVNGERVRHVYVTKVIEPELTGVILKEYPFISNDFEGTILVKGFTSSPLESLTVEIDLDNISRAFERK